MKLKYFLPVVIVSLFAGVLVEKINHHRRTIIKDEKKEYHKVCKSQLMKKISGIPCSTCASKWEMNNAENESIYEKYVIYQLNLWGKKMNDLDDEELNQIRQNLIQLYIDKEPNGQEIYDKFTAEYNRGL